MGVEWISNETPKLGLGSVSVYCTVTVSGSMNITLALRVSMILALFLTFLLIFGLNAYSTFNREDLFLSETKLKAKALKFPAVTICVDQVKHILQITKHEILLRLH